MQEPEDVASALLVHRLVEEQWEAKGRQIQSVSNPLQGAGLCRQWASGQLTAPSACLKYPAASWSSSPPSSGWGRYYSLGKQVCFQNSLFSTDADWSDTSTNVSVRPLGHFLGEEKGRDTKMRVNIVSRRKEEELCFNCFTGTPQNEPNCPF